VREISAAAVRIRAMRPKYDDEMLLGAGMLGVGGVVNFWGGVGLRATVVDLCSASERARRPGERGVRPPELCRAGPGRADVLRMTARRRRPDCFRYTLTRPRRDALAASRQPRSTTDRYSAIDRAFAAAALLCVVVSGVRRMNEVNARRARLVPGWVTVFGRVCHLGM